MKYRQKTYLAIVGALLLGLLTFPAFAQSADIVTAEVDRRDMTTDEYVTLSVIIQALGGISEPAIPPLDGFDLIGTSSSTNISIINGVQSTEKVFMYTLHPRTVGELTIGSIAVQVNGQVHHTNPITVQVTQGTGIPPSHPSSPSSPSLPGLPSIAGFPSITNLLNQFGFDMPLADDLQVQQLDPAMLPKELLNQDYLLEAEINNPTPFMGEQITYTLRYYRPARSAGTQSYQSPSFSGFWVHPEPEENHFGSQIGGRNIRMTEIKHMMLPTVIGEVEIEPAQIISEGDIFTRGFTLQTQPKKIVVQPLPAGAPAGFTGAVGDFNITAEIDSQETKVNDAVTLRITINGIGNLETFGAPEWEIGPEWRAFDSQAVTNAVSQDGMQAGERIIEQVLVPTMEGEFTIPAVQFSFFDPDSETYQTSSTQPIVISVAPDGSVTAPLTIDDNQVNASPLSKIRPLKDTIQSSSIPLNLTQNASFWLLWIVPLFLLIGQYSWHKRNENLMKNPEAKRNHKAAKKAYQALKEIDVNSPEYFSAVGRILTTYLSDKLNRSVAGLTLAELSGILLAQGVSNQLVEQVRSCLTISEMGQYSPFQQAETKNIHTETKSLISELEKVL